jgi:outer membrane protein assembly factor BamB
VWKVPLKGRGQSSPVIWNDRIFLTTAIEKGAKRIVFCISRKNGATLWEKVAWTGVPEKSHNMNGHASPTCVTDGERVYAFFGKGGGLHCYTMDGKHEWSKDLGPFTVTSGWGTAACPILVGDFVIQNCDADEDAYICALNKRTGDLVWKTPRENNRGWSTPVLVQANGRQEIVVNGHTGVRAYDPKTGKDLWFCSCIKGRGTPTVTPHQGMIYVLNGLAGGGAYAIKTGGSGDVTSSRRAWMNIRRGRDLPSPVLVGDYFLAMSHRGGLLTCYNAKTGDLVWGPERIGGQYSASPIVYGGKAFFINEVGETLVVKPDSKAEIVARNILKPDKNEIFRASITPSDGHIFIRSDRMLYCIGE